MPDKEAGNRVKILILDDDPFALKLLSIQLRAFGLKGRGYKELVSCEHGSAAVELLEADTNAIGLVFCDLQMPAMDGVEFVRHMVRLNYRGGLILVSGQDHRILQAADRLAKAHGLRVLAALQKPVLPEQLRKVLDEAMPETTATRDPVTKAYGPDAFRRAIDCGQIVNHYQPKIDMASGAVVGAEALARWQHPEDGLVMPASFIEMAEDCDLINDMTKVVLKSALTQARRCHEAGHRIDVAVNVSMANLSWLEFPDFVAQQADEAGVALGKLVLELTESQLMSDPRAQLDILTRLRLKGVRLSIDDFGTGYSSLAQLRDVPFDELKIDRGFVHRAARDPSLRAILEASLGLAQQLGMKTVAEGIEEREDWDFLRASGCDMAQGYFMAKPMAAQHLVGWMGDWQHQSELRNP